MVTTLRITGMTCNRCVRHVDKALREVAGVTAVSVNLDEHAAKVTHDSATTLANLVAAVESQGYKACHTDAAPRL